MAAYGGQDDQGFYAGSYGGYDQQGQPGMYDMSGAPQGQFPQDT